MAFNIATAKPVGAGGFNPAAATPVRTPSQSTRGGRDTAPRREARANLEGQLAQNQEASDLAGMNLERAEAGRQTVKDLASIPAAAGELALQGASYIPAVGMGAVQTALGKAPGGSYAAARDQWTYQPRTDLAQDTLGTIAGLAGKAYEPVRPYVEPVGEAILEGGEALGVAPQDTKNIGASLVDALGLGLGGAQAATRGVNVGGRQIIPEARGPAVAPGAPDIGGRTAGAVNETLPSKPNRVQEFRAGGFVVPPSTVASSVDSPHVRGAPGLYREALGGGPAIRARMAIANQGRTNQWAARALGLPETTRLNKDVLRQFRAAQGAPYDELRATVPRMQIDRELFDAVDGLGQRWWDNPLLAGDPAVREASRLRDRVLTAIETTDGSIDTNEVLDAIRKFRESASISDKALGDPTQAGLAEAYRAGANALEDALERQAAQWGSPDLVERLRQARTNIAKSHDIESALIGENVDIAELVRKYERGDPLSGELEYLARMGQEFGREMKTAPEVRAPQGALSLVFSPVKRAIQNRYGPEAERALMSPDFQNQFGEVNEALLSGYLKEGPDFPWSIPPEAPPGPGGGMGTGAPVPFSPTPNVPPGASVGLGSAMTASDIPAPGGLELPPAAARPGDLEARPVPPIEGDVPFQAPETDILSALGLADEPRGGVPYRPGDLPPEAAVGGRLELEGPAPAPAPGSGALGLDEELLPPLTDMELLDLDLGRALVDSGLFPDQPGPRSQMTARPPGDLPPQAPPAGGQSLFDELSLAEDNAPAPQRLELDEGGPVGGGRKVKTTDTGLDLYEGPPDGGVRVGTKAVYPRSGDLVLVEGDPARAKRALIMRPQEDGSLRIASTEVDPASRGSGLGKDNLLQAIREGTSRGARVDSDNAVSVDQMRVYESLTKAGRIEADQMPDWGDLIKRATQSGQKSYKRPGDAPVVSGLRLGPKGPKSTPSNVSSIDTARKYREAIKDVTARVGAADREEMRLAVSQLEDYIADGLRLPEDAVGRLRIARNSDDPVGGVHDLLAEIERLNRIDPRAPR